MYATDCVRLGHTWLQGRLKYIYTSPDKSIGECIGYYENGGMKFHYTVVNEKLHGAGRTYYENGRLEKEEFYNNDLLDGPRRYWYPSGELSMESFYKQGMFHGSRKEWHRNGKLKRQQLYVDDRATGVWCEWYDDGTLKEEVSYRDGLRHGVLKQWGPDGKIRSKKKYIRGVLISGTLNKLINSGELSAQYILSICNIAIRRVCLEEFGYARFLTQVPHQVLDKGGDQELVKINWHKREEPIFLLKVKCPSTGAFYTLRVPPLMQRVRQAVAWTFGVKEGEYAPQLET